MGHLDPVGGSNPQKTPRVTPFGKYLLLDRIAVGGMAEVYTAKSFGIEGFEKIIAIKRILPTIAEDADFIMMFIDEAKICGHLTHANVVPIYELGKIGESHYIAMEYVWGKDVLQIMNRFRRMRRHMPPVMAAWIASKMLEGLDYSHRKRDRHGRPMGIIHRDVSPQNCIVSYEGQIKMIDFGIAKAASRNTKTQAGVLKGKFGYMSPEQVRGLSIDHRSDIFAASTCLHEMLTGERLFVGESDFSTLEKVRNADVTPPSRMVAEIPSDLEKIVLKGLSREPDERWQTAGEMQEELQRFIALQRPPFGTSKLNTWMRTAFAPEIAKEKARLDSFNKVGHPGATAVPRVPQNPAARRAVPPPPNAHAAAVSGTEEIDLPDDIDDLAGEATMITASPFDALQDAGAFDELTEEPTQIFFSADDLEEIDDAPPATAPAGALQPAPFPARPMPAAGPMPVQPVPAAGLMPGGASGVQVAQPAPAPMAATQAIPQSSLPVGPAPTPAAGQQQPQVFAAPPPTGRNLQTMEVDRAAVAATRRGGRKWIAVAAVAALCLVGISAGLGLFLFGGDSTGTVSIRVMPEHADARIFVDDVQRGRSTLMLEHVPAGEHEIQIRAEGFHTTTRIVPVNAGSTVMLEIALEVQQPIAAATPPPTQPRVAEAPAPSPGAELTAPVPPDPAPAPDPAPDPAPQQSPTADPRTEQPAGQRTRPVRVRRDPPQRTTRPVRVASSVGSTGGGTGSRRGGGGGGARAGARAGPTGTLTINTMPWARVFVDGRDTGRNTPVRNLRVPAGDHTIGLRTNDGTMHTVRVTVPAGGNARIVRQL